MNWFLRMSRWARNPPSEGRVKFVLAIVATCFALFLIEYYLGWPEWLTPERVRPPNRIAR